MTETLTLTDIIDNMRGAVGKISMGHTRKCDRLRDSYWDDDYRDGSFECDCFKTRAEEAKAAMQKLLDYVDGKDFKVKLEFTIQWG